MGYFDELIGGAGVIARAVTFEGKSLTTFWRQLTAGEKLKMQHGQVLRMVRSDPAGDDAGKTVQEVELGQSLERSFALVFCMCVTKDGAPAFSSRAELEQLPARLVDELIKIAEAIEQGLDAEKG
jgi:hypothetical protein